MAGLTQNDLKGYIIGTNQFNFQDARVDDLENVANVINRTQGQQGIEVRNNRLCLTNGGYYDDGALFEEVVSEPAPSGSTTYTNRNLDGDLVIAISGGDITLAKLWILGSLDDGGDGFELEAEIECGFEDNGDGTFSLSPTDNNIGLSDYGISSLILDTNNNQFVIEFDSRAYTDYTIEECAVYTVQSEAMKFPGDMIETDTNQFEQSRFSPIHIDESWLESFIADYLTNNGYEPAQ